MAKKDIGHILVQLGVVGSQAVDECRAAMEKTGQPLEQCLAEQQVITPEAIATALASYVSVPYVEKITDKMADLNLLAKIPLKFLRENVVIPVVIDGQITILTANPLNFAPIDELNLLLGGNVPYAVATSRIIIDGINRYYPIEGTKQMIEELAEEREVGEAVDFEAISEQDILGAENEAPIIKLVNHILYQAVKRGASDIHIEPFEKEVQVRYRIDGVMYHVMSPPKRVQAALVSRIKIMGGMNIAEKRLPQGGRIQIKVADKAIDIRVSVLPVTFGERVVMRLLDKTRSFGKLQNLGFSKRDLDVVLRSISQTNGIIFVTGPTGSGKTSTLYSIISELNTPEVNIVTVEDPVEYQMSGIGQVQVKEKIGLTFAAALREILRQDPDIIMIGETRDQETAQIAIQAALTGHLVFSTLHTNDAPSTITRLIDMGIEPFLIASSVIAALAQRLVRRLCPKCKIAYKPAPELIVNLGLKAEEAQNITFYKAVGCEECNMTGYRGRLAIFEVMVMTNEIARLTMARADTMQLGKQAQTDGMTTLLADGIRKIKEGLTSIEEVLSVATAGQEMIDE
jgi:general secretion pathway protein E